LGDLGAVSARILCVAQPARISIGRQPYTFLSVAFPTHLKALLDFRFLNNREIALRNGDLDYIFGSQDCRGGTNIYSNKGIVHRQEIRFQGKAKNGGNISFRTKKRQATIGKNY